MNKEIKGKTVYYNGEFSMFKRYTKSNDYSEIEMNIIYKKKDYRVIYNKQKDIKYKFPEEINKWDKDAIIKEIEGFFEVRELRDILCCE